MGIEERILFEDNHLIVVNKLPGEIVQGDKTGDVTLAEDVKAYLKEKYSKPGNVFLGIPHRLDRPTSGIVIYCKTSKCLERMNQAFRDGSVDKYYLAICDHGLNDVKGTLVSYIYRDSTKNKSFAYKDNRPNTQEAKLEYEEIGRSDRYTLLKIHLLTGRHHQIRAQLAANGVHIKGDLKYGFPRSEKDGGICLHSYSVSFNHPVSKEVVKIVADLPDNPLWDYFSTLLH